MTTKPCPCSERQGERVRDDLLNRVTICLRSFEHLYRDIAEASPSDLPRLEDELRALSGTGVPA